MVNHPHADILPLMDDARNSALRFLISKPMKFIAVNILVL